MITVNQLHLIARSASKPRLSPFVKPLNGAMKAHAIDTMLREAAFLAMVSVESGDFYFLRDIGSGNENERRLDLGNTQTGDGPRFKGRGLLPLRGRTVYELCGESLGIDLIKNPDLLEEHPYSSQSAAWYWAEFMNMNQLADQGAIIQIVKRLTNRFSGISTAIIYYDRAIRALELKP